MKISEVLPEFYKEIEVLISNEGLSEILEQLPELEISGRCHCGDSFCSTFYVKPLRQLNVVEKNIIGARRDKSVVLNPGKGMIVIDLDNFGRIVGFEVLYRPDVKEILDGVFKNK